MATNLTMTEMQKEAKRREITEVIESDPDLFMALAEEHPVGRKILEAIRTMGPEYGDTAHQKGVNGGRVVTYDEAMKAIADMDIPKHKDTRADFINGKPKQDYVSKEVPLTALVTVMEFAQQQAINNNPDLYVLQDSRSMADDQMLFWAKFAAGYTTELDRAHRFTKEEAEAQHAARPTDIPHRVGDLKPASQVMLKEAAKQVARAKEQSAIEKDPTALPKPTRPDILALKDTKRPAGLYALFSNKAHSNDTVMLVGTESEPNKIDTIVFNPDDWKFDKLRNRPGAIIQTMELAEFASRYWEMPDAHRAMSYNTWEQFIEFVGPVLEQNPDQFEGHLPMALGNNLPSDLPPRVAQQRMELLDAYPTRENLKTKVQLSDIEMASLYGEPVHEHIFAPEQLVPTWHDRLNSYADDMGSLYEKADMILDGVRDMSEAIKTKTANGEQIPNELKYALAISQQTQDECDLMIDSLESRAHRQVLKHPSAPRYEPPHPDDDLDEDERLSMAP